MSYTTITLSVRLLIDLVMQTYMGREVRYVLGKKGIVWTTNTGFVYVHKQEKRKIRLAQSKVRDVVIDIEGKMYVRIDTPRHEELLLSEKSSY